MAELGALLRQAREERGISLLEAEQATRIRRAFLQAIEEERFADLPGEVYGRGFVRTYARFLGLDPEALLQEYARAVHHEPVHVPAMLDEPLTPLAHRLTRWVLIALVLVLIGAGAWYLYDTYWVGRGWRVQSVWPPVISTPTGPAEAVPEPAQTPGVAVAPPPTPGAAATQAAAGGEVEQVAMPTPTATATATPGPTATPTATPTPLAGVHIEAFAEADTYLEVRADGELLWIGILRASESAEWSAEELMQLRIGNAGGLQLLVNGRDVGSLGASGQVINVEYRLGELP